MILQEMHARMAWLLARPGEIETQISALREELGPIEDERRVLNAEIKAEESAASSLPWAGVRR